VYVVALALPGLGLPVTSAAPLRTWTLNAAGVRVPALSLTTVVFHVFPRSLDEARRTTNALRFASQSAQVR